MTEYSKFLKNYVGSYGRYQINSGELWHYVTYLLSSFCMPTFAGIKPSCLIRINKRNITDMLHFYELLEKGVELFECKYLVIFENEAVSVLLVYHQEQLYRTVTVPENAQFLNSYGYELDGDIVRKLIKQLKFRYEGYEGQKEIKQSICTGKSRYPHEIGIILGFPMLDVTDFIRFQGLYYLYCGYWKVYHDVNSAVKLFDRFSTVRNEAVRQALSGKSLQDIKSIRIEGEERKQ